MIESSTTQCTPRSSCQRGGTDSTLATMCSSCTMLYAPEQQERYTDSSESLQLIVCCAGAPAALAQIPVSALRQDSL